MPGHRARPALLDPPRRRHDRRPAAQLAGLPRLAQPLAHGNRVGLHGLRTRAMRPRAAPPDHRPGHRPPLLHAVQGRRDRPHPNRPVGHYHDPDYRLAQASPGNPRHRQDGRQPRRRRPPADRRLGMGTLRDRAPPPRGAHRAGPRAPGSLLRQLRHPLRHHADQSRHRPRRHRTQLADHPRTALRRLRRLEAAPHERRALRRHARHAPPQPDPPPALHRRGPRQRGLLRGPPQRAPRARLHVAPARRRRAPPRPRPPDRIRLINAFRQAQPEPPRWRT